MIGREGQAKLKHMLHSICEATTSMTSVLVLMIDLGKGAAKQILQKTCHQHCGLMAVQAAVLSCFQPESGLQVQLRYALPSHQQFQHWLTKCWCCCHIVIQPLIFSFSSLGRWVVICLWQSSCKGI